MRKIGLFYATVLLALFLYGCLPSLHPLYTDDTVVYDEQLLGKWYGDGGGIWSFTKNDRKSYELRVIEDDGKQAFFEVHLVELGEHRFIDLYPGENMELENTAEMYGFNLVPAHTFMKATLSEPNLLMQWVCLNEALDDDPNLLKHEKFDDGDNMLITAQPEELQRVTLEYLDKVVDSDEGQEFRRCPAAFSEKDMTYEEKLVGQWKTADDDIYLDIITWNDGYDILCDDDDIQLQYKGRLFEFRDQKILGLYTLPVAAESKTADPQQLIPDVLVLVESIEPEMKLDLIEWKDFEAYINDSSQPLVEDSDKGCEVFQRIEP